MSTGLEAHGRLCLQDLLPVSAELVNDATESLRDYSKFVGALISCQEAILCWSGQFHQPSKDKPQGCLATSKGLRQSRQACQDHFQSPILAETGGGKERVRGPQLQEGPHPTTQHGITLHNKL